MKSLICYCAVDGTTGVVRNRSNTAGAPPPELVMGLPCELELRLFADCGDPTPYPMEQLTDIVGWSFAMDTDFSPRSTVKLFAGSTDIRLSEVVEDGSAYTRIAIALPETHTAELAAALDGKESILLDGELIGYGADREELFVLQIRNFVVRGRLTGLGDSLSVLSAVCEAMSEETISSVLVSGGYVVSSGAELIASGAVVGTSSALDAKITAASGGLQSQINTLSGGTAQSGAMIENQPFSTTVGGYAVELTSNGGFSVRGSGASATLSGGAVNVSATQGVGLTLDNSDEGVSALVSVGLGGVTMHYDDTDRPMTLTVGGGVITADSSAITQISSGVEDTSLEIDVLEGGVKYYCSSALSALSIGSAAPGCNATIFFTAASGAIVTPPSNVPYFGVTSYTPGSSYVMAVNGDMAVVAEAQ